MCDQEIDESYVDVVNSFSRKITNLKSHEVESLKARKDIVPDFDKIRIRVGERIKEYFIEKFKQFKTSKANLQAHQSVFLKLRDLFRFLIDFNPEMAAEVRNIYVNCIGM